MPARLLPIACGQYDERMNLGFPEMIFLFFFALILFGPKKLPEIGRALNEFKRASNEFRSQIESEISQIELEPKQQILAPTAAPVGTMPVPIPTLEAEIVAQEPASAEVPSHDIAPADPSSLVKAPDA